jgi:hypothetical protein
MSPHELVRQDNLELDSLIFRRYSAVPAINTASVSREQIFSVFLDHYFPIDQSGSPRGVDLWHYLITSFVSLPQKTHMLESAITAISCVYLGKSKSHSQILRYGLQLYNQAIQEMSSMICRNIHTDDIIYTTVIFQEIEVILASTQTLLLTKDHWLILCFCVDAVELPLSARLSNVASPHSRNERNHEALSAHKIN